MIDTRVGNYNTKRKKEGCIINCEGNECLRVCWADMTSILIRKEMKEGNWGEEKKKQWEKTWGTMTNCLISLQLPVCYQGG